jgi:hypothetical protein
MVMVDESREEAMKSVATAHAPRARAHRVE